MPRNRFLTEHWQAAHLEKIKNRAGSRYTPELNVDLPIAEIFDGLSRTERFYKKIRTHHGQLTRHFSRLHSPPTAQPAYQPYANLQRNIAAFSKIVQNLSVYSTEEIPWRKINIIVAKGMRAAEELSSELRRQQEQARNKESRAAATSRPTLSESLNYALHTLYKIQNELRFFEEYSRSSPAQLSNRAFLLLKGVAGAGKTHLLCDIAKNRFSAREPLPTILVFGEHFGPSVDPTAQVAALAGVRDRSSRFLQLLDCAGKQSACRSLLIIDAVNETRNKHYWKRNLVKLVEAVKQHPNIALVISVRSGFEHETIARKWQRYFISEEHRGFEFQEWEAVQKFFHEFNLPLPQIPLLTPEFQNPLFLLLFCRAFQNRAHLLRTDARKQVFRGHEGATYIFETFVNGVSKKILRAFGIPASNRKGIWNLVIKQIAEEMVNRNDDRLPEEAVLQVVKAAYPNADHVGFIQELERNLIVVKVPGYSRRENSTNSFDYRFPFQKFSDHLFGRYIFKNYETEVGKQSKNKRTAKKFFSRRRKLGRFLAEPWNMGIVEALSIQCPEHLKGHELVDVAPYLQEKYYLVTAFTESLVWRKPSAFQRDLHSTLNYINSTVIRSRGGEKALLNALLSVASIPNHPLNAKFLHRHLARLSMAVRDSWWSTFLHKEYGAGGAVDRLLEWSWSSHKKEHISDEAIELLATAMSWFLTTPNRFVRDRATKGLVEILTGRLQIVRILLERFHNVNDPYVLERLYAIAYGCALRSAEDKKGLRNLAVWIYSAIFKDENPPVHILLRDYARSVLILAISENIKFQHSERKITPPFRSSWPMRIPTAKWLRERYYPEDFFQRKTEDRGYLSIWSSVMYDIGTMGDFGRYVLNSALGNWSQRRLKGQSVDRKRVFESFKSQLDVRQRELLEKTLNPLFGIDVQVLLKEMRDSGINTEDQDRVEATSHSKRRRRKRARRDFTDFEESLSRRLRGVFIREIKPYLDSRGMINDPLDTFDFARAQRWLFARVTQLGWTPDLHGDFDDDVNYDRVGRSEHKPERIGKKYQWIALHELLARVSDNFEFKGDSWLDGRMKYEGSWELGIRDIDPSCTLATIPNTRPEGQPRFDNYLRRPRYDPLSDGVSDTRWMRRTSNLPDARPEIELLDDCGTKWLLLEGHTDWEAETPPENERYDAPTRRLWYLVKGYVVARDGKSKLYRWAKRQDFGGQWMPESHEFWNVYLGEYPWAPAFLHQYVPYYHHAGWTRGTDRSTIPVEVLVADDEYRSSGSSIDCSTPESISVKLPAKAIVDEMKLRGPAIDGRFFDTTGDLIAFDPAVFDENMPNKLLVRKDKFCYFLRENSYSVVWTVLGEKNMIGGGGAGQPLGWLTVSGAYTLGKNDQLIGSTGATFQKQP